MFTIEFLVTRGGEPTVVETVVARGPHLADATITARYLLSTKQNARSETAPEGYQILDEQGRIVARHWEPPKRG
jgi:hypothetical protein